MGKAQHFDVVLDGETSWVVWVEEENERVIGFRNARDAKILAEKLNDLFDRE